MGSLEDLFQRQESVGNTTFNEIVNWLSNDGKKNKESYRNVAVKLAEPFGIREEVSRLDDDDIKGFRDLLRQAKNTEISDQKTVRIVQTRLDRAEALQEIKIKEEREKEIQVQRELERERTKKIELKQRVKEAETSEEQRQARKELARESPQTFGGIKSGESRRSKVAFRYILE